MNRRTDARTRQGQGDGHSCTGVSRRDMLKGLAAIVAAAGCPDAAACSSETEAWLRRRGPELADLAGELAEWERIAIGQDFPDVVDRLRYITVIEWRQGIIYCCAVSPAGETESLVATKAAAVQAGCRVLADGWSEDRRVGCFFATGEVRTVRPFMRSVAPSVDAWREFRDFGFSSLQR